MIKRLKQYFRKRREIKLRKWCIEKAVRAADCSDAVLPTAKSIYEWIKLESPLD